MEMNVTYAPHPLTTQGREARLARWEEGRTIREHLIACGVDTQREIVIYHNTRLLTVSEWDVVCPRPGDFLHVEGVVSGGGDGSNPIATILSIAVMVIAPELAPALIGIEGAAVMGSAMTAFVSSAITAAVMITGNLIISAMFKPSQASSATQSIAAASPTYSLSGGSNRIRPYEPLPVLMGNHRIFPDYGAKPYTEFEGEDQYLYQVFNFGLGNLVLADLRIGETLLSTYSDVTVTRAENGVLPGFWGNVDSAEGAALSNATGWVTRTTGTATTQISLDLVGTYYYVNKKGGLSARSANFEIEYCVAGTGNWQPFIPTGKSTVTSYWSRGYWANTISDPYYDGEGNYVPGEVTSSTWVQVSYDTNVSPAAHVENSDGGSGTIWRYVPIGADPRPADSYASNTNTLTLSGASSKPLRRTVSRSVASGQYDVRVRRTSADETDSKFQSTTEWAVLRSYQEGVADYSNQTVLGIKIKASGQLNGALEQLSALGTQSTWVWSGGAWNWATTTNPAWWYLALSRGMKDANGKLLYGGGLSDEQIDIEGIKAWAVFCEANALSFSAVFDQATTLADALQTIARCGFASPSWGSGKLGVVWDAPNQTPVMAFGMANICKGSFEVSYVTDNLADEIVVNYTDRNKSWESGQVRVTVPGTVGTPVKTSTVDLMGCTTNAHAAKFANALAAQQYYRRRNITWETDFEGFVCQRGDVVILSHDLTQWGYSGRLMAVAGNVVTLSKPVPRSGASDYLMIQSPDGETEVFTLTAGEGESDTLTLPAPFALQSGYAAIDHKWYFSPLPTPGKKVKITSVQPLSETRLRLTATDEYPEYYAAWNGVFTQPATQTLLDQNGVSVSDLTLTLNQLIIDGFQINRVTAAWNQRGGVESCTVSAWLDGASIGTWTGIKGTAHTLDLSEQTGTVIVEVTPIGTAGPGASVIASLDLQQLPAPAAPTLTVTGGLFAVNATWAFGDEREDIRSTEVWFASTNDRTGAVRLTAQPFPATKFDHIGLQPGAGGYYWARVIDTRGNPSAWHPVSPTGGLYATASTDPSLLLDQLQAALGMDQLAAELATPIGLISAADTVSGSVNARIKAAQDNLQAQINDLSGTQTYDAGTTYATDDIVQYDGGLYKATQATTGNLPTNTTYWVKVGDYTSLGDGVADHTAKIEQINYINSGSTSASAQALASLQATINDANTGLAKAHARITAEETVRANADTAEATARTALAATISTLEGPSIFTDNFESDDFSAWASVSGSGEMSRVVVSDAASGGSVLRIGNNSGNDQRWLIHARRIPFDPLRMYRITAKVRRTAGTGTVYFGFNGFAADGTTNVNIAGANLFGSQHYHAATNASPASTWTTYVGYTKGFGASTGSGSAATISAPGFMHPNVRFLAPMMLVNYSGQLGVVEIDSFIVEDVTEGAETNAALITEQTTRANADTAIANDVTTVQARLDTGDYAAVKTRASASASKITRLEAKWVLQVDANGKVAGMSLASGSGGTAIAMLSDKFLWYQPDGGGTPRQVFSMGTVNGVTALGFDGSAIFDGTVTTRHLIANSVTADKIDSRGLTIKDASGNVILGSGTGLPIDYLQATGNNNLLDTSTWAVDTHDSCPGFNRAGGMYEQWRYVGGLPDGSMGTIWKCWPQLYYNNAYGCDTYLTGGEPAGDADGGWNTDAISINSKKTYRFVVYVRREGGSTGYTYLGCGANTVRTMPSNTLDSNPYFSVGNVPVDGNWYMIAGYVYPETWTGVAQQNKGGIWSCNTGQKIANGTDYIWAAGATETIHRAFLYYAAVGCIQEFSWPRVDLCDGNEPTLDDLLSMGSISARNQITAANISTYIASAAIDSAQIKDAAITTAKIGQAQIDTLRLAGNAVTVPVSASHGTSGDVTTVSSDFGGGAVHLTVGAYLNASVTDAALMEIRIYRDGGLIKSQSFRLFAVGGYTWESGSETYYLGGGTLAHLDFPGAGSHYYRAKAYINVGGPSININLLALGVKR